MQRLATGCNIEEINRRKNKIIQKQLLMETQKAAWKLNFSQSKVIISKRQKKKLQDK